MEKCVCGGGQLKAKATIKVFDPNRNWCSDDSTEAPFVTPNQVLNTQTCLGLHNDAQTLSKVTFLSDGYETTKVSQTWTSPQCSNLISR